MKKSILKLLMSALPFAFIGSYCQTALAHTQTGSLGDAAGVTDIYLVTCSTGDNANGKLEVSVINVTAASPLLTVKVDRDGSSASATDAVSGDGTYSPKATVIKGDGGYTVTLNKAGAGKLNYSMEYHCKTGSGLHTGDDTSISILENDTTSTDGNTGEIGAVFKLNSSGIQYCPGFQPAKFSPSNDIDLWLQIDSETQMTVYLDSGLTDPVVTLNANFDSITSTSASFDAFYDGNDADNRFEAIGVLKFKSKDGSAKSLKATFLRKGILNSCYSKGTLTGKRIN